jgi:hypothetical protein
VITVDFWHNLFAPLFVVHALIPGETVGADVSAMVLIHEFPERTT